VGRPRDRSGNGLLPEAWLGFSGLPLLAGLTVAVLRYRLFDVDRIISRTVAYGLLTLLLGGGYAAVVLGLGRLLPQGSSLGVAATTTPLRRSPRSAPACAIRSTSTPSRPSCSPWPSRRCSRPRCHCGCDHNPGASRIPPLDADQPVTAPRWFSPALVSIDDRDRSEALSRRPRCFAVASL
jgi:hypothetical protein